jgi:catabolite regulation protein CreA
MEHKIQLLDTVALLKAIPALGLNAGQVGTVVEVFGEDDLEVEFVDKKSHTIALLPLKSTDVLVLQYEPASVQ